MARPAHWMTPRVRATASTPQARRVALNACGTASRAASTSARGSSSCRRAATRCSCPTARSTGREVSAAASVARRDRPDLSQGSSPPPTHAHPAPAPRPRCPQLLDRDRAMREVEGVLRALSAKPSSGVTLQEGSRWLTVFQETAYLVGAGSTHPSPPHAAPCWPAARAHRSRQRLRLRQPGQASAPAPSILPGQVTTERGRPLHPDRVPPGARARHPFPWRGRAFLRLRTYQLSEAQPGAPPSAPPAPGSADVALKMKKVRHAPWHTLLPPCTPRAARPTAACAALVQAAIGHHDTHHVLWHPTQLQHVLRVPRCVLVPADGARRLSHGAASVPHHATAPPLPG